MRCKPEEPDSQLLGWKVEARRRILDVPLAVYIYRCLIRTITRDQARKISFIRKRGDGPSTPRSQTQLLVLVILWEAQMEATTLRPL